MFRPSVFAAAIAHLVGPGKIKIANRRLVFSAKDQKPLRLDASALKTLFCYGPVGISDDAFDLLFSQHISVVWLSRDARRCRARLVAVDASRASLRLHQYRAFLDPPFRRDFAAHLVVQKIDSQILAARHYQRHGLAAAADALQTLDSLRNKLPHANLDEIRGIEGAASARWFALLGDILQPPWSFSCRSRRPPKDPVNALLSLGYTLLFTRALVFAEACGFETYLGAFHDFRPGRPSLACDLIEPFRVPAVDRWVIGLCNRQEITPQDFFADSSGFRLQPERFGAILHSWEKHYFETRQDEALQKEVEELVKKVQRFRG
ncbi:MAG: CRISPR-associated endonuclease Cas1 3 [Gemmatales bacterium]|nr:MAG: CRISPR-associated endonuclease Cas1 3 [Gemmatales bacterium]